MILKHKYKYLSYHIIDYHSCHIHKNLFKALLFFVIKLLINRLVLCEFFFIGSSLNNELLFILYYIFFIYLLFSSLFLEFIKKSSVAYTSITNLFNYFYIWISSISFVRFFDCIRSGLEAGRLFMLLCAYFFGDYAFFF